jgi:hypothetical protein
LDPPATVSCESLYGINFTNEFSHKTQTSTGGTAAIDPELKVEIERNVKVTTHPFKNYFKGFEKVDAIKRIFGDETDQVLDKLRVEFAGMRGYMGVSEVDGHLLVSALYLKEGDQTEIYLDIIHELVHVRQFMEGKKLFDHRFTYTERPTEIEAYRYAVEEARRLGWDDERICNYLKTEWMSDEDLALLAKTLNVNCPSNRKRKGEDKRRL